MEILLYIILLIYFIIGAVLIAITNRRKNRIEKKYNWKKYFVYLIIINTLFFSILLKKQYFTYICLIISIIGIYEIINNAIKTNKIIIGIQVVLAFIIISYFFILFSFNKTSYLLYTLFIVTIFDAFSQLIGQIIGKNKIFPKISPNKTYEGLIGGLFVSIITSILIRNLLEINIIKSITIGFGVSAFAFIGDFFASYIKRKYGIKDFSNLLPGHGGVLDRFDSLIMGSLFSLIIIKFI